MDVPPRHRHPYLYFEGVQRQPDLVRQTLQSSQQQIQVLATELVKRNIRRVVLSGIGSSYHLALAAAYTFRKYANLPATAVDSSEALFDNEVSVEHDVLFIGLSASGNTRETVEHLSLARRRGAATLAVVNLDGTRLTAVADAALVAAGGFGLGWDFSTRGAMLSLLAAEFGAATGDFDTANEVRQALTRLPELMAATLTVTSERCQAAARELDPARAVVVIGSAEQAATACEMALRFEEVAHLPARARGIVDFLHGGVGLLAHDIVTILLASAGERAEYENRIARVTAAVKTPFIAVVDADDTQISALADYVIRVPSSHPVARPMLYQLITQLLPYYVEVLRPRGNPDAQRTNEPRYARAFDIAYPPNSH